MSRYLQLRVNDESISYFCDVYPGVFLEILSVSSIFYTHILFDQNSFNPVIANLLFKVTRIWEKGAYFNAIQTSLIAQKIAIMNRLKENVCRNVTEQLWHAPMVCSPIGLFFSEHMIRKIQIVHVNLTARKAAAIVKILFSRTQF